MLFSFALIIIFGLALSAIFGKLKLPGLLAMVIIGMLLGPNLLDLIDPKILEISGDLRKVALIVILFRVGISLDLKDLYKVGRPAFLMCFIPAIFEMTTITLVAPFIFNISYLDAAIMGAVLAAVSPAVVVPRMLNIISSKFGQKKAIPQLVMAGASVDDIFVIVVFATLLGMHQGQSFSFMSLALVPVSLVSGLILGILAGYLSLLIFRKFHMRDTIKVILILSIAFCLVALEESGYMPISGLIAVMSLGGTLLKLHPDLAERLTHKFSKLWVLAEIILFVLVGAAVDLNCLTSVGIGAVVLILVALLLRITGVFASLLKTDLNNKERLFCAIAYTPKATVQAAIGAVPLAAGVASGNLILSMAVLAILITAPLGAIGIDASYKKLLTKP